MQTSTSSSAQAPADIGGSHFSAVQAITTTHLILIAVLAVVVVIGMIYGGHLKRCRKAAEVEEQQRLDAYDHDHADAPPCPVPPTRPVLRSPAPEEQRATVPPPSPSPVPASSPVPPRDTPAIAPSDDAPANGPVTQLKGLGPKVATRLAELGITTVGQIAGLDDDAAAALDAKLGAFQGRIARDRWVEQARFLAAGDRAGFEAVFGRL